jgi:hypothetical protein
MGRKRYRKARRLLITDHRRLQRQQWSARQAMEGRTAEAR